MGRYSRWSKSSEYLRLDQIRTPILAKGYSGATIF